MPLSWSDSMIEYQAEFERRTQQFASYLELMHRRAHDEIQGSCFIVFSDDPPHEVPSKPLKSAAKREVPELVSTFRSSDSSASEQQSSSDESWEPDSEGSRFIQVAFSKRMFYLDLPNTTLFAAEAENVLREVTGLFRLKDRPTASPCSSSDLERFDPLQKQYVNGDERSAAEDIAFIFFRLWKFPVESVLYVTAAAFGTRKRIGNAAFRSDEGSVAVAECETGRSRNASRIRTSSGCSRPFKTGRITSSSADGPASVSATSATSQVETFLSRTAA